MLTFEELFRGTINSASVHPREIVKSALRHNAAACILAYNHPSYDPGPSSADQNITVRVRTTLEMVEVRTLDHVVIGDKPYSFAENGLL